MFKKFNYNTLDELKNDAPYLPVADLIDVLKTPVYVYGKEIPNRLCNQPMEGCDGNVDGSPSELVIRRYKRFAKGGAGVIWVEACAVSPEARANPRQLMLTKENLDTFKALVREIKENSPFNPFIVLQLTHSGRYSKPGAGMPAIIATNNEYLDPFLPEKHVVITDDEIRELEDKYIISATLAKEAGFDAVDIKACHRYLNSELLSSYTREGDFGGTFENRTRFLLETVEKLSGIINVTTRINAFDEIPYPYGFGVDKDDFTKPDYTEIKKIAKLLFDRGVRLINITGGNPYYNPHVNRPYDMGGYTPESAQTKAVLKLLAGAKAVKEEVPGMCVISSGFSWLREYGANVAAGGIEDGWFDIAGFGRQSFAYPDFPVDIINNGKMERSKCCITCSKCTQIMRNGGKAGCPIRDSEVYMPIFKECTSK